MNEAQGIKVDVDFQVMIEANMQSVTQMVPVNRLFECLARTRWLAQDMRVH